jgi:hypothetical protein
MIDKTLARMIDGWLQICRESEVPLHRKRLETHVNQAHVVRIDPL